MLPLKLQIPNSPFQQTFISITSTGQQLKEQLMQQCQINGNEYDIFIVNGSFNQPLQLNMALNQQGVTENSLVKFVPKTAAPNNYDQAKATQFVFNPQNPPQNLPQFNQPILQQPNQVQFPPNQFNFQPGNQGAFVNPLTYPSLPAGFNFPSPPQPTQFMQQQHHPGQQNIAMMPTYGQDQNQLKRQIDEKNKEIEEKNKEIEELRNEIEKLKRRIRELLGEDTEKQERLDSRTGQLADLEMQLGKLQKANRTFKLQIDQKDNRISELEIQVDEQERELSAKDGQMRKLQQQTFRATNVPQEYNFLQNNDEEVSKLRKKNNELQKLNSELKVQLKQYEDDFRQSQQIIQQVPEKDDEVRQLKEEIETMKRQFTTMKSKIEELDHNAMVERKKREDREATIEKLQYEVKKTKQENEFKQMEVEQNKKMIEFFEENFRKIAQNRNVSAIDVVQRDYQQLQVQYQQQRQKDEQKQIEQRQENDQKDREQAQVALQLRQQNNYQQQKIAQEEKRNKAVKLREAIMSKQGVLQVGLLIDVTGSMDQYKDATMNVIDKLMKIIKDQTNRDCEWGSVCYQDFAELKQRGQYYEHQFTKDQKQIMKFLKDIKCDGGDDGAEDLRGGIKQMVKNLPWEKSFKIALLVCDAPSHGQKWAGNVLDDHKDEDLTDALKLLIEKNIILIGIEFDSRTDKMFQEMKAFYATQKKSSNLITISLKNLKPDQIQDGLIKIISEVSVTVTEVKQSGTKTKLQKENREGAFEALVKKLPDPSKFTQDPNIQLMDSTFEVFRVEIKQQSFEQNQTSVYDLRIPQDYQILRESQWNCVRTKQPFAFGQLKAVYLMKKKESVNSNEVYVIKMPIGDKTYPSIDKALEECRSHLISQKLMQKFISDLQAAPNPENLRIPQIRYSDFLILKENNNSYWIAERFFNGQFLKYNNNNGYINSEESDLNLLAQTFTFYTYHTSDFNYMISDVQGVGANFTDPAINTITGQFDDTDMGQEGIGNYIVSFEANKAKYIKYLKMLQMDQD